MCAAIDCALANRQILAHLLRQTVREVLSEAQLSFAYDVSSCKVEEHWINGRSMRLCVHRKGAAPAFEPGHPDLPEGLQMVGSLC
jgi:tRNA-splicing ligase RtcB